MFIGSKGAGRGFERTPSGSATDGGFLGKRNFHNWWFFPECLQFSLRTCVTALWELHRFDYMFKSPHDFSCCPFSCFCLIRSELFLNKSRIYCYLAILSSILLAGFVRHREFLLHFNFVDDNVHIWGCQSYRILVLIFTDVSELSIAKFHFFL